VGGGMNVLEDQHAIRCAIKNWLHTRKGQRVLLPRWGNKIHEFLFDPVTRNNAQLIGEEIDRLSVDIPAVFVDEVNIDFITDETGNASGYHITFTYNIPTLDLFKQEYAFDFLQSTGIANAV
jgi:phage baseplate assembly protein W